MPNDILVLARSEALSKRLVAELRKSGQQVSPTSSAQEALRVLRDVPVKVALFESGFDKDEELRSQVHRLRPDCRLIFTDSFENARVSGTLLEFGSSDYILCGSDLTSLITATSDRDHVSSALEGHGLFGQAFVKTVDVLVGLQEADDRYFAGFTKQVTSLAGAIAEKMGLSPEARQEITIACLLRDIGKAGVSQDILCEKDKLTAEEYEKVKHHALWSVRLLEHIQFPGKVLAIIRHHHERYDGMGYPNGLKGRQIPVGSRIIAAAETFVATVSDRPHRAARSREKAIEELMSVAGNQLDPEVVEVLLKAIRDGAGVTRSGSLILVVEPDREFRRLLRMRLLNDGYDVVVTDHATGDLNSLVSRAPDLVLFAATNGAEEAFLYMDRLSISEGNNRIPFALLVAEDNRELRLSALRRGVDDLILKSDDLEEIAAHVANILMREGARRQVPDSGPVGLRGHLGSFSLPDIIQMLCMGKKTAVVRLSSSRGTSEVWFRDGAIVHAECGPVRGEDAFYDLMQWEDAEFLIQHGMGPSELSIEADPMSLLMEHLRRTDEREGCRSEECAAESLSGDHSKPRLP